MIQWIVDTLRGTSTARILMYVGIVVVLYMMLYLTGSLDEVWDYLTDGH